MRRVVEKKVTVVLSKHDVHMAVALMARCPLGLRATARIVYPDPDTEDDTDDDVIVSWVESSGDTVDNTQPDADPAASARRRRRDLVDLTGHTFGRWTVLGPAPTSVKLSGNQQTMWLCRCECGTETPCNAGALKAGATRGCKPCYMKTITVPDDERRCRWAGCGVKLASNSRMPHDCPRCLRQKERRGICPCGKGVNYATKPCTNCGRRDGKGVAKAGTEEQK